MRRTIYIAGQMASDPNHKTKFDAAETYLIWKGWNVLNPAWLPQGLKQDGYMPICLAMLNAADAICLLDGSQFSHGARIEEDFAGYQGKTIYHGIEVVPTEEDCYAEPRDCD